MSSLPTAESFLPCDLPSIDISSIQGNAKREVKEMLVSKHNVYCTGFGGDIAKRLKLVEASFLPKCDEPKKFEAKVVYEIDVDVDMLNGVGNIHGGCSAFLVDWCSTASLGAYTKHTIGTPEWGVSQNINVTYHSPAALGEKLRIINTTMTVGTRIVSARTEVRVPTFLL
ncbi:hypothetical protein DL96DRAFT_1707684 [Flagelloscypha sp. PMI_526]|nr:hypothetical protein DL96DRAFT_1707684 [Flagelloscypha sp. PMI_526]